MRDGTKMFLVILSPLLEHPLKVFNLDIAVIIHLLDSLAMEQAADVLDEFAYKRKRIHQE